MKREIAGFCSEKATATSKGNKPQREGNKAPKALKDP